MESRLGEPAKARALYDRALELFEKEQAGLGQANTHQSLGDLESRLGNPDEALALYEKALTHYASELEPMGAAYTLAERARCLHSLTRMIERDESLHRAWRAAMALGDDSVSRYVRASIVEVIGGEEQAKAWLKQNNL